ncbi:hypothetical protein HER10_EVM0013444 [Colletotrichum scovillei]|uniref:Zinc fyve domain containing protein n=1 Tax=Colletotrichum scovillei TaxID=1209932 RepID=A0A9P7QYU3_9PEZI|nr:uncharacterized protein HER10_EVM0013444 [Colletotrichum scovillei]KAF4784873.1 hypothetical protein HER10_EVM0013444 [Colletotrichum scovillei]KAG7044715.1 zinc fyve domain containing protein [Colletotrichum scovillei]KAG7049429.1 zinc fyve domain containing protein [Colletotrichum scovillei]KAG7064168.1 zinc fyve domain containing protein [Colletotrichum scovillei]
MSSPDKSLLDRLNALKGGSPGVSLDRSSNALNVSLTGIEPAKPPSREDALAARLRSLRNTPEREEPPQQSAKVTTPASSRLGQQSPASPSRAWSHTGGPQAAAPPQSQPQQQHQSSRSPALSSTIAPAPAAPTVEAGDDDVDPLLQTDDQTLEDLLSDEDFGGAPQQWQSDPKDESAKVNALLEELSKTSVDPSRGNEQDHSDDDDDDSDGGEMGREVNDLLSQALEEAKYNSRREPIPPTSGDEGEDTLQKADHQGGGDGGTELSLPSVPLTIAALKADDEAQGGGASGLPDLGLPSVPSSAPKHDAASDFDNDIAARMAALSGLGGPSSDGGSGGMGLPSVPTFQPADRSVKQKRLTSKTGYTDEDAATWCTVCLEDGTLQCLGCEDVYCTRCWHEMHVGPAAAFDDRTHKAVRFVKPGKDSERRVMLGAS